MNFETALEFKDKKRGAYVATLDPETYELHTHLVHIYGVYQKHGQDCALVRGQDLVGEYPLGRIARYEGEAVESLYQRVKHQVDTFFQDTGANVGLEVKEVRV